jgi:hypothetical protein
LKITHQHRRSLTPGRITEVTDAPSASSSTSTDRPRLDAVDLAAQLLNPGARELPREIEGGELAQQAAHHSAQVAQLRHQHADLLRRRMGPQARRVLARMLDHERRRVRAERALAVATAGVPSLLDQVIDAIESSSGTGGRTRSHAHRSPIGLAAAQLVGDIEAVVGHGPREQLARRAWGWAVRHSATPRARAHLGDWLSRARQVVEPARPVDLAAPCPACGESVSWAADDTGQVVRRAALQIDRTTGTARCTARPHGRPCGATWSSGALTFLANLLEAQAAQLAREVEHQREAQPGAAVVQSARLVLVSAGGPA